MRFFPASSSNFLRYSPHHNPREEGMAGKVGFIGLGAMGGPMARNLIGAGTLVVHDIDASKTAGLNAEVAGSAKEVASKVDFFFINAATTEKAQSVIGGIA